MSHRSDHSNPSQRDRVLEALRQAGPRGISAVDFMPPNTIDGGKPILRLPSRIFELREMGYVIDSSGDRRNKCDVYRLIREPNGLSSNVQVPGNANTAGTPAPTVPPTGTRAQNAIFGYEPEIGRRSRPRPAPKDDGHGGRLF